MAGTVTTTMINVSDRGKKISFAWTADAADGSVPSTELSASQEAAVKGWYLVLALTDPGAVAPTADYDIVLNDDFGIDVMGGELADRSSSSSEQAVPKVGSVFGSRLIDGGLSMVLTGNSVNSATGEVVFYFVRA